MVPAFGTVAVGLVVLGLAPSGTAVVVAAVIMGLGNGLGAGAILTLGSDLAPSGSPGPFLAGMSVLSGLGRVIGSLLVGAVGSWLGLGAAAIGLGVVLAIAIAWLFTVIGESSNLDEISAVNRLYSDWLQTFRRKGWGLAVAAAEFDGDLGSDGGREFVEQ